MKSICPVCGVTNKGDMPKEANHSMAYGAGLRAFVVLLSNYACVSMNKINQILTDVFGIPMSTGTIANTNASFAQNSKSVLDEIKVRTLDTPLIHKDESGMNMNGKTWWIHTSSTAESTYITAHPKRGNEGIDDNVELEDYMGIILHDFWVSYFRYKKCLHAMCCAHLLRELNWVTDNTNQTWSAKMCALLCEMKIVKEKYLETGKFELSRYYVNKFAQEYSEIICLGETEAPRIADSRKQTKPRNLLDRFINYKDEITLFAYNFNVPFDNNLAERDIRNAKVKHKVSGAFRSEDGIKNFAKISSILGTATKQGLSAFATIKGIISGSVSSLFQTMNQSATE
jgi:transposase